MLIIKQNFYFIYYLNDFLVKFFSFIIFQIKILLIFNILYRKRK